MVSGIFSFDFDQIFSDFDRKIMKMMPMLPIYALPFIQMGMGIDGVPASPINDLLISFSY